LSLRIRQCDVKVGAVRRDRTGECQYLPIAVKLRWLARAGKPDPRHSQAADALQYEARFRAVFSKHCFKRGAQVLSGKESQRKNLHGEAKGRTKEGSLTESRQRDNEGQCRSRPRAMKW